MGTTNISGVTFCGFMTVMDVLFCVPDEESGIFVGIQAYQIQFVSSSSEWFSQRP